MTTEERLRSLLEAATPGPWHVIFDTDGDVLVAGSAVNQDVAVLVRYIGGSPPDNREANAEAIVEAVNALPKLLAVVSAARDAMETLNPFETIYGLPVMERCRAALAALDAEP